VCAGRNTAGVLEITWMIVRRLWPLIIGLGVAVVVYRFPAEPPNSDFYGIVAQVIPVLIVAIALDGRGQKMWDRTHAAYRWQITASLLAAEVVALLVTAGTLDSGNVAAMVCTVGLVGGFLAVAVIVLVVREDVQALSSHLEGRGQKKRKRSGPTRRRRK
jgi:hypothetical protein